MLHRHGSGLAIPTESTTYMVKTKGQAMTKPKLQVALDTTDLGTALHIAAQISGIADRIEVGTPLLRRHGIRAIEAIRDKFAEAVIVADSKIMDCGESETAQAIEAGASGVVVQAAAPLETIEAVCLTAEALGAFAMVDCIGIADLKRLAGQLRGLPVSHLVVHKSRDEQHTMGSIQPQELIGITSDAALPPLAVAGGIGPGNAAKLAALTGIDTIIVGQAIVSSRNPRVVALRVLAAWNEDS